jgi:hypothetical protein
MGLGVEDDFGEWEDIVRTKEEIEILEGFRLRQRLARSEKRDRNRFAYKPKALHVIPRWRRNLIDIANTAEPGLIVEKRMLDEGFEHLPAPVPVVLVSCDTPHVEQTLHCLRAL